ncbi:MAG: response regulator, partial [Planctomycetota bacterium]
MPPLVHVVDDEETIHSLFASMAQVGGFEVARYTSATDFLDGFEPSRTGCLVLDLMLPDRTGIELL